MTLFSFKSFQATGAKQNKGANVCTPLQLTSLAFVNPSYSIGVPGFTRLRAFLDTSRARGRSRLSPPDLLLSPTRFIMIEARTLWAQASRSLSAWVLEIVDHDLR